MEEQILENYLSMPERDLAIYEDETTITHISFPIYQAHIVDPMLFCVDTSAPHFCVGDNALEGIIRHSERRFIPIIDCKRDFKFGDTIVRPRGIVELMLPRAGSTLDIPLIFDVEDVDISTILGLDVLDGNNLLVDNLTNHI